MSGPCFYSQYGSVKLQESAGSDPNFDPDNGCYGFDGSVSI